MFSIDHSRNSIEILEARIAPASAIASAKFIAAITGSPILLHEGQLLTTAGEVNIPGVGNVGSGTYLLYVEKGDALVFTTDFNNNKIVDFNEITGIAAGDGLRMTTFVDIYGDIVTNLNGNTTLSDSNNNSADDDRFLKGDGKVVLNNTIEKIEFRSLTLDDVLDENSDGDTTQEVLTRLALTSYSIHGNIYAGKGFGVNAVSGVADATGGLIIDDAGRVLQDFAFNQPGGADYYDSATKSVKPSIGFIRTGSAVSGEWFTFGISAKEDTQGYLANFTAPKDQVGGDIAGVHTVDPLTPFNIAGLIAGDGGVSARGGDIVNITLNGDNAGGYIIKAGSGGRGPTGGTGGSILNFQDISGVNDPAAVTGRVVIQTGDGGVASTGAGGNGGVISLGPVTVNGGLGIKLGNGGDGFTAGGTGASLATAEIVTPEGKIQYGSSNLATTHVAPLAIRPDGFPVTGKLDASAYGVIGRYFNFDFDHDGFSDAVYTSADPNELTVLFGNGDGTFRSKPTDVPLDFASAYPAKVVRISLDAPVSAEALTVADFNHDGFADIVTASSAGGNFGGISVFLAQTEDTNDDGILSDAEDLNHNHVNEFVGFRTARQSFLPSLNSGDPDDPDINILTLFNTYGYKRSAVPISDIEAGDFNGDGYTDIAVAATYTNPFNGLQQRQIVMFFQPDIENGRPTGQFYADVGTKAVAEPAAGANPFVPFFDLGPSTRGVIEATAMTTDDTYDKIVGAPVGTIVPRAWVLDNSIQNRTGPLPTLVTWGRIDLDRGPGVSFDFASVRDFTIYDSNNDDLADMTFIVENHPGFMVSLITTEPFFAFDTDVSNLGFNNAGYLFRFDAVAIRSANTDGDIFSAFPGEDPDANIDNVAVLLHVGSPIYAIAEMEIDDFPPAANPGNPGAAFLNSWTSFVAGAPDGNSVAFDTFLPVVGDQANVSYFTVIPDSRGTDQFGRHYEEVTGDFELTLVSEFYPPYWIDISEHYVQIEAGNGGNALIGKGGVGGFLGGSLSLGGVDVQGELSIFLPENAAYSGFVDIRSGKGGNGFSDGGAGGIISGTSVRYTNDFNLKHTEASLHAGDGGFGVGGKGGNGGSLRSNSIESGILFEAGNGGRGRFGGNGGEIIGHGFAGIYDSRELTQQLVAGKGGNGVKAGGNGGDIRDFHGDYNLFLPGTVGGLSTNIAGDGGNAISGPGGRGGSVINDSPLTDGNRLGGDILLQGGRGGTGLKGGDGGDVTTYLFKPSVTDNPAVLSVLAGDGGRGISGNGGHGGMIDRVTIPSKGTPNALSIPATPYAYNRFLAGNGGSSAGKVGGEGGIVNNVQSTNTDGPFVVGAGAGGKGLTIGGIGGSVTATTITVGGESLAKALIIAGAGGSATAFIANPGDAGIKNQAAKAFGGQIGVGGLGGSIDGFTQNGAIAARIDLIAGDGGSTLNYGGVADSGIPVGVGGSIRNISLAGSIGNVISSIPIKSYNDVIHSESVADFVNRNLRDTVTPGSFTDDVGLVGLVVGAAGRLKETQFGYDDANNANFRSNPAFRGINGDAMNISARNIMSMVAGSVERIAAIQTISGITVVANGALGVDKTNDSAPYRDRDGNSVPEPVLDGRLVDGAIIYKGSIGAPPNSPFVFKLGS